MFTVTYHSSLLVAGKIKDAVLELEDPVVFTFSRFNPLLSSVGMGVVVTTIWRVCDVEADSQEV